MAFAPDEFRKLLQSGSLRRDQQRRQAADRAQRNEAEKEYERGEDGKKIPVPRFLRPQDLEDGMYDVERALRTTLGLKKGELPRVITRDDIIAFQENIKTLRDQYDKGITPKNVINLSVAGDIDRANQQITMVAPYSRQAGIVHFVTNASKGSVSTNHHVNVEFVAFGSVVSDIEKQTVSTVKNRLAFGKVRFECDCGRHTYWYRYMATIGGYGLGRKEAGFPKVRNPNLIGVACKHVLKVMQFIMSASGQQYLKTAVDKDRSKQHDRRYNTPNSQLQAILDLQEGKNKPIQANLDQAQREMFRREENARKAEFKRMNRAAQQAVLNQKKLDRQNQRKAQQQSDAQIFAEIMAKVGSLLSPEQLTSLKRKYKQ